MAQLCRRPTASVVGDTPVIATTGRQSPPITMRPNWLEPLAPQHHRVPVPSDETAQVCRASGPLTRSVKSTFGGASIDSGTALQRVVTPVKLVLGSTMPIPHLDGAV